MAETAIIIPVYATKENKRAMFLLQTLQSVARQNYSDFLCLVVDDGSPDKMVEGIVKGYAQADQRFRYLHRERKPTDKITASNARNRGLEELLKPEGILAGAEFVTFLDSDDLWPKNSIEARVDYLKQNPDAGAVYSDFVYFKGTDIIRYFKSSSSDTEDLLRETIEHVTFHPISLMWRNWFIEEMSRIRSNGTCTFFNPEIVCGEDRDVAIATIKNAFSMGYSIRHIGENLYFYRINPNSVMNTTPEDVKKGDNALLRKIHEGYEERPIREVLLKPYVLLPEPVKKMLRPLRNELLAYLNNIFRSDGYVHRELTSLSKSSYTNSTSTSSAS